MLVLVQLMETEDSLAFRPHRRTTYVDAAYCYTLSSVVYLSVCLSVTVLSLAKNG